MEKQELEVQKRIKTGKGVARKLRAKGFIPAVCYRKGIEPIALSVDKKKLEDLLHSTAGQNILIQLKIRTEEEGQKEEAVILKEVQRNNLSEVFHADFLAVRMDETIVVEVPIRLIGEPTEALRSGGLVQELRRSLEAECLPGDMPDHIEVDISNLTIGESIHVEALQVPEGLRVLTDPTETIVVISAPEEEKAEEEKPEEEEGAEAEESGEKSGEESSS